MFVEKAERFDHIVGSASTGSFGVRNAVGDKWDEDSKLSVATETRLDENISQKEKKDVSALFRRNPHNHRHWNGNGMDRHTWKTNAQRVGD
ncbi:hypothetical protein MTO96_030962 [Rhipicephalus appendiculatus]